MPVVRSYGTSVREKIAAFEKKESTVAGRRSENSIIRAKYEPDVRGVNRFRHFHTPIPVGDVTNNGFGIETHLPSLVNASQNQQEYKDIGNGLEKGSSKKKQSITLPQLNNIFEKTKQNKQESTQNQPTEGRTRKQEVVQKTSSDSDGSAKFKKAEIKLPDALTVHQKTIGPKRTFATFSHRQNGAIIKHPLNISLEVVLPPRSKSAQDLETRSDDISILAAPSMTSLGATTPRNSKDIATQTSRKHISTASVEFLNCVRSTQTDSTPIVINSKKKSDVPPSLQDIEEREALLEVIEDALLETFDRYSRVRTNQIIANSARRQAQIWRDVKDFLGGNLFPSAIQLANRSQTREKTAAEIVASIRTFP